MAQHHYHSLDEIKNPGPWKVSSGTRMLFMVLAALGFIVVGAGLSAGQLDRVWANVLTNFFFYLCISLGGAFFIALIHITGSFWGAPFRRVAEGLTVFLPVLAIIGLAIYLAGGHTLYHWMHTDALAHDKILTAKAGYLNTNFAIARALLAFGIWIFFSRKFVANSLAQDITGDVGLTHRTVRWSAAFVPLFATSFSFLSFDYLMSLEPHWFSTIFGVYCFAGLFYSTLATLAVVTILMKRKGVLPILNENNTHDIGKMMFAFSVFWAYIMFSQFMLIWYANLPEETTYYLRRFVPGWAGLCWTLLIVKFIIPFFGLLPRGVKRRENYVFRMAVFMLFAHWLDCYLMVMPNFSQTPVFGWIEIGTALGFFGLFAFVVTSFFAKVPAFAFRDPRLLEAANFHQ